MLVLDHHAALHLGIGVHHAVASDVVLEPRGERDEVADVQQIQDSLGDPEPALGGCMEQPPVEKIPLEVAADELDVFRRQQGVADPHVVEPEGSGEIGKQPLAQAHYPERVPATLSLLEPAREPRSRGGITAVRERVAIRRELRSDARDERGCAQDARRPLPGRGRSPSESREGGGQERVHRELQRKHRRDIFRGDGTHEPRNGHGRYAGTDRHPPPGRRLAQVRQGSDAGHGEQVQHPEPEVSKRHPVEQREPGNPLQRGKPEHLEPDEHRNHEPDGPPPRGGNEDRAEQSNHGEHAEADSEE